MKNIKLYSDMFKGGEAEIDLDKIKLIDVPAKRHYNSVSLCFTEGENSMNFSFIEQYGKLIDYDDLSLLFKEIADRWNKSSADSLEELETQFFAECEARNFNCGITYQSMTNFSVEVYQGYKKNLKILFYSDGLLTRREAIEKGLNYLKCENDTE